MSDTSSVRDPQWACFRAAVQRKIAHDLAVEREQAEQRRQRVVPQVRLAPPFGVLVAGVCGMRGVSMKAVHAILAMGSAFSLIAWGGCEITPEPSDHAIATLDDSVSEEVATDLEVPALDQGVADQDAERADDHGFDLFELTADEVSAGDIETTIHEEKADLLDSADNAETLAIFDIDEPGEQIEPRDIAWETTECPEPCDNVSFMEQRIQEEFGFAPEDYLIVCSECHIDRGGHFHAKILMNGQPLELFYHWGWCSSGGTDCGWYLCFTSFSPQTEEVYATVKNRFCEQVEDNRRNDGSICTEEAYDHTAEARNRCFAGEFERIEGSRKTLAIDQISNRCWAAASPGDFDCWNRQ